MHKVTLALFSLFVLANGCGASLLSTERRCKTWVVAYNVWLQICEGERENEKKSASALRWVNEWVVGAGTHMIGRWALPVRWHVAVPRCSLGSVCWHGDGVSSDLSVLRGGQQRSCWERFWGHFLNQNPLLHKNTKFWNRHMNNNVLLYRWTKSIYVRRCHFE